uniref:Uncharacterized protein n=1 Tax=Lates calcarifer TaxID=8187 RepID=A0A4W6FSL4_LATCA
MVTRGKRINCITQCCWSVALCGENLPGRNCLTRTKQCEVVLKISTDTLRRRENKYISWSDNLFKHISLPERCITDVVMSSSISETLASRGQSFMAGSGFKTPYNGITSCLCLPRTHPDGIIPD